MFKLIKTISLSVLLLVFVSFCFASDRFVLKSAGDHGEIGIRVVKRVRIPKWYHEGLFFDGDNVWVCNGKLGQIWIVDKTSGKVLSSISPIGTFMEGISKGPGDKYFVTDWDAKKVYIVRISDGKMSAESSYSFAPAYPAGVAWTGTKLYVITWRRGLGTKFNLVEMDEKLNVIHNISIRNIEEPAHMAWDGANLWITSWYSKLVYKVDIDKLAIVGKFNSPVSLATGISWDGKSFWLTGTYGDLYQLEVANLSAKEEVRMGIKVTSSAFKEGEMIPAKYTCDGDDYSPPLEWSNVPAQAKAIALISDDPDAPMGTWVHWVIFNIPPSEKGLDEKMPAAKTLKNGANQGVNDGRQIGYGGPCPPSGVHRYYFKVYALDKMLDLAPGATKKDLLGAMEGHILAEGQLMGRYKRK